MIMNVLNVIYKDTTVNINHSTINIYEDYIQIFFVRTQDNDCKFFCQWLDANRIDYEKKERDSYTIIKVDTNIFNLDIAVKFPIKSSELYNNFYKAIYEHERDITNTEALITKYEEYAADKANEISNISSREHSDEYHKSLDNTLLEILEYTRCKYLEIVALTKEHLDVSRGTLPVVDELKVAYHVSELFSKDDYRKLLYIQEYLNNKSKLSKQEEQYLETLWNSNDYEYPEVVKEVEAIGQKKFNEYYDKALKFVENVEDLKENIEEKLNKFYQ
nr:MAG TPA: hypothetical protein [Crassvirales sp.]